MHTKVKKILFFAVICICTILFMPNKVDAATYTDSETGISWYYELTADNKATNVYVNSYSTLPETLVIPDKMEDTYPVIGIKGFSSNIENTGNSYRGNIIRATSANTSITSVVLPETLETIEVNTFANFKGITSIVIPNSVTTIKQYAFYSCTALTEITIPATVAIHTNGTTSSSYLQRASFYGCSRISKITITEGVTTGSLTKGVMPNLTSIYVKYMPWCTTSSNIDLVLEDGVTTIGNYGFYTAKLKSVQMSNTLKTIGSYAFYKCESMTTLELPDSITTIGENAFMTCTNWANSNFKLPASVTSLGAQSFYGCSKLTGTLEFLEDFEEVPTGIFYGTGFSKIVLPNTVKTIKSGAFQRCTNLSELVMPENLETIESQAFESCTKLEGDLTFPDSLTTIGTYAFQNCTGFNGKLTLGAKLANIGNNAFFGCTGFKEVEIISGIITKVPDSIFASLYYLEKVTLGDSVTEIGKYAFRYCYSLKELPLTENITKIGNNAFQKCTGLTGNITFPDTVKEIGDSAFYECTGLNGIITLGKGITVLNKFTFYGCPNIQKVIAPNNIKEIQKFSLWGVSDLYYLGSEDEVLISKAVNGSNEMFVHYKNCIHKLEVDVSEGFELINAETGEVLKTAEYTCDTSLKLAVRTKTKAANDISVIILHEGKYKNSETIEEKFALSEFTEYQISEFNRDYKVIVKDTNVVTDLNLRNYIYQINYNNLVQSRVPNVEKENGIISYNHTKVPVQVNTGDLVTIKVRVYNEGNEEGLVNEITEYLPEGLTLANSEINRKYGWVAGENGKVSTRYFENKPFAAYSGKGSIVPFEEISLICKVTSQGIPDADQRLVVIGEITSAITKDIDSTYGQITSRVDSTFKNEESYGSTANSYVKCDDDDTDFENVVIKPSMPVEYSIKVTKIDSETQDLLSGAVFNLKDTEGNIVSTAATDENGVLKFGVINSYGEGTDIFYIEEALAPEGYRLTEKETIEVKVTKTIIDETLGTYSLKVICQTLNYSTDITRYDYNPIATAEHLAKIGSGEWIEYEGYKYQFTDTANYKLIEDIDLDGIVWTPISKKITGIFDGNNHSIKNLTIVSEEDFTYSEVGLFRSFSGIVQGLHLENVNIQVPGMVTPDEENGVVLNSISGYTCVGGFAGFMEKGTVKSCSISGEIKAGCSNVGGFVGHSAENNIIKFQNCTNSATITGYRGSGVHKGWNIGGLIGCAIGSLSIDDCVNEGEILGEDSNVGGLVGFVNSTGYEEVSIKAEYSEADKTIGLVIGNTRTNGKYDLILENRDVKTLGFITGAKYTVYNSKLEPITGFEDIELENGNLKVASVDIDYVGTDTYYIKEISPAPGYSKLKTYVKLVVSREWNGKTEKFEVSANADNIINDKIEEEPKQENTYKPLDSTTGEVFAGITQEVIGFYNDKVSIVDCANKGDVTGYMNVGGLLGTAYCNVQIDLCNNKGNITASGYGKAGGVIAEVRKKEEDNLVEIKNTTNEGDILSTGSAGSASGIIAHSYSDIEVINCTNKGGIATGAWSSAAGIIADLAGTATVRECVNSGNINNYADTKVDKYCSAGGIIGKNFTTSSGVNAISKEDNNIYVYDCLNTGTIKSASHIGGIVAMSTGTNVVIQNCINKDNLLHAYSGDNGGIIGFTSVNKLDVIDCVTKNTEFSQVTGGSNYAGLTGGILGCVCYYDGNNSIYDKVINIKKCDVLDCNITSVSKEVAGIFGGGNIGDKYYTGEINISECNVERCYMENKYPSGVYSGVAGLLSTIYSAYTVNVSNSNVKDCDIKVMPTSAYDTNVGGLVACIMSSKNINLTNCNVENTNISNGMIGDSLANTGGIIGAYECDNTVNITNCDLINSSVNAFAGNLGGIAGLCYNGPTVMKDCDNVGVILFSTSTSGSSSNTGGMIGHTFKNLTIDNCTVQGFENINSVIYGRGQNIGGFVGHINGGELIINNSKVQNVTLESETGEYTDGRYDSVGGFIGGSAWAPTIKNSIVENCEIEGNASNVAGIAGYIGSGCTFENVIVRNAKINNRMTLDFESTNTTAGGMTGTTSGANYKDCIVENCEVTGNGRVTGGFSACIYNTATFNNCKIKDTKILKEKYSSHNSYTSVGGFVAKTDKLILNDCTNENVEIVTDAISVGGYCGYAYNSDGLTNNTIKNLKITLNSPYNNQLNGSVGGYIGSFDARSTCTITNCDIDGFNVETDCNNIGGIIGTGFADVIDGCDVNNLQAKYTNKTKFTDYYASANRAIAGIIAVENSSSSSATKVMKNCTVTNSTLTALEGVNNKAIVAGLVGYSAKLSFNNCDVTNTKIINETEAGVSGGILANSNSSRKLNESTSLYEETYTVLAYDDVQVKDSTISAKDIAGGIVGYGVVNITNSGVENCTIEDKTASTGAVGGIVGMSLSIQDSSITNTTVKDTTITGTDFAGGIAGFVSGTIDNCTVSNTKVSSDSTEKPVGGIAGMAYDPSNVIKNSTVLETEVTSENYAGGIVGYTEGNLVDNTVKEESTIATTSATYAAGGILGLTSNSSSEINNCDVDQVTVKTVNGYAGGIAGFANNTISGADVNNATIIATGTAPTRVGGILGQASSETATTTVVATSTIANTSIQTIGTSGKVAGDGLVDSTGCTVDDATVVITTPTASMHYGAEVPKEVLDEVVQEVKEEIIQEPEKEEAILPIVDEEEIITE